MSKIILGLSVLPEFDPVSVVLSAGVGFASLFAVTDIGLIT